MTLEDSGNKGRLHNAAEFLVWNYESHGLGDASKSDDRAMMLAVHYLTLNAACDDLLRAYMQRDDLLFAESLQVVRGH